MSDPKKFCPASIIRFAALLTMMDGTKEIGGGTMTVIVPSPGFA